ncbi:hypothetical protein EXIGLDRAFT_716446 [Exidia glandulosa HHB12029]|uniref:MYND-type domain-containing protein n=1 Tax=Exidia glandulosa HHB12029 TaxID=1314781 RepID=A0A165P8H5_EXIGL|nr:hypothetical protein EXIGLDRAFT_716446 [Exidia glandulosa HHB12029]
MDTKIETRHSDDPEISHISFTKVTHVDGPRRFEEMTDSLHDSREEIKERVKALQAACSGCGADKPVTELKRCTRCLTAHYCNKECQTTHWPTHKKDCQPKDKRDLSLKLAQRLGAQVTVMGMLSHLAILELDVLANPHNADTHYLRVPVRTQTPDLTVLMQRIMEGKPDAAEGESLCLQIGAPEKAAREGAPAGIEAEFLMARKRAVEARLADNTPVAVFCYHSEASPNSFVVASTILLPDIMAYAASNPTMTAHSAMFGVIQQPWDQSNLREQINQMIRQDSGNKLKLRGKA